MIFNTIDTKTWNRAESYQHFISEVPCTYSMTVNLDVTKLLNTLKLHGIKFFPAVLYGISLIVNRHRGFRMDFDTKGNLGFYDCADPCWAVFQPETETFLNVWAAYSPDFHMFLKNYEEAITAYRTTGRPMADKNIFNVSCIPWTSFTGFHLNLQKGYDYLLPIFTLGKYTHDGEKTVLPLAIQVHHAVCDGFHLARFVNELQEWANSFALCD